MSLYLTSRSSINCFFKAILNVFFPLIDLKENSKLFQMVPAENINLDLNRLFLGLGKERL